MADRCSKNVLFTAAAGLILLAGCASEREPGRPIDEIYDEIHRRGSKDAVEMLRDGMRERMVYGVTDPYIPLRQPDEVVPVWVPAFVDPRTGRRIDGHWEHTVIRRGEWVTD